MTKFKSQNEVDMEDFNDNKPSQKWLDWLYQTFDMSEEENDGKTAFWIAMGLLVITSLALYGLVESISSLV